MEVNRRKLLEEVMRRLIEGELAMVWALSTEFRDGENTWTRRL